MNGTSITSNIGLIHQTVTNMLEHSIFSDKKYNLLDELLSHLDITK